MRKEKSPFFPQYRARSRLRRKQALRAQSSFGEAGQSAHWIGKLKKSPPRITPKRDWAAMETNHAASPGSAPCSCARCGMLSLCFPPHTLECANVVFACPTNGTTAKRPAFVRRGQGAMLRALRSRRRGGASPFGFRFKRRNTSTPFLFAPQTAPSQNAQRSADEG